MDVVVAEIELANSARYRHLIDPAVARAILKSTGTTQEELARALRVHRVTVHRWLSGEHLPRGEVRVRYGRLLEALSRGGR